MKLKIEFIKMAEKKEDETSVSIEVHQRRGTDIWNTIDAKEIAEGNTLELNVPNDSRVLLVGPGLREDQLVYDQEQKAAVKAKDATPGRFVEQGSSTGDGPKPGVETDPKVQKLAEDNKTANQNINTQAPNTKGVTGAPSAVPGAGIAKPGEPAKPTGVSNQQTLGSPPPSQSQQATGTVSADQKPK